MWRVRAHSSRTNHFIHQSSLSFEFHYCVSRHLTLHLEIHRMGSFAAGDATGGVCPAGVKDASAQIRGAKGMGRGVLERGQGVGRSGCVGRLATSADAEEKRVRGRGNVSHRRRQAARCAKWERLAREIANAAASKTDSEALLCRCRRTLGSGQSEAGGCGSHNVGSRVGWHPELQVAARAQCVRTSRQGFVERNQPY